MATQHLAAAAVLIATSAIASCGNDDSADASSVASGASTTTAGGSPSGAGATSGTGGGGASAATSSASTGGSGAGASGGSGSGGANPGDIPGGGVVLFEEKFDDANFAARGWYDGSDGTISASEHATGSASSFECAFAPGASSCSGGKPARHLFTASQTVYMSFWMKFGSNWVGSGVPYHPHMFHFLTDADSDYVGPSHTFLTTYTEVVDGEARLALQDSKNVDLACILQNNDNFVGCNGDFSTYPFTENRSACSCNGLLGDLDTRDCFANGDGTWYSSRGWSSANAFVDAAGPNYKADWHFVEAYFEMNTVQGGVGMPDGKIRWVQDGQVLISHDAILLRTNAHASLAFNQFAVLPYIGVGSPIAQSFWIDDLTVATARP